MLMNIAFFTDSFKPNTDGVATVTSTLAEDLVNKGHKVTIVCPGERTEIVKENGYKTIRLKSHHIKLYRDHKVCFKPPEYVEKLEDFRKYDLIHLQTNITLPAIGYLIALKYDKPVSCTFHTNIADFATSFFDKRVFDEGNPIIKALGSNKILLGISRAFAGRLVWNLTKNFHKAVPTTTVPSKYCKKLLTEKGVKNPILVLNNPVNPKPSEEDYSEKYEKIRDKFTILHVGRLSAEKRVDTLIKVMKELKEDEKIHAVICSRGPLKKKLEELSKELKVSESITFTGYVPRDELNWLYENCDVVVNFGLFETFNICATEGLYYGKPLLLTDAGPHPELIQDNGYLVEPGEEEVEDFAEKLKKLIADEELRKEFSENSRRLWEKYDYEKSLKKHEAYFINSVEQNMIKNHHYWNFIKYLSNLSITVNTLLFTLSLKFDKLDETNERFNQFFNKIKENAKRLRNIFK